MPGLIARHRGVFLAVLAAHLLLLAALGLRLEWVPPAPEPGPSPQVEVIEAMAVSGEAFDQARQARMEAERQRQAELERQRREEAERQRQAELERQRREEAERQRQAELERQRREEAERQRQAELERQRREEAERQRQAELERQRREEAERQRQAELERQRQAELERQRQLEAERRREMLMQEQRRREQARLEAEYVARIQYAVERNWRLPSGEQAGQSAVVFVRQTPGGYIREVRVEQCNGTPLFCDSVERAVRLAEPLPEPPDPDLFQREIRFTFAPS
ncbi:cell envelope integrity protein TolA [Ectothiorhodospira mobilis]|uniref:cell envelope integrity protein TolA n=1 Tax=Ectothiorhodospira mobilis TaxID=195064 RepID=UPI0019035A06|nr:cell envelope integrity protein TolA [Ectothiorhodospira mobilis]MBK1691348.1 protein TolA [Ectothiorhodospira mobilis]